VGAIVGVGVAVAVGAGVAVAEGLAEGDADGDAEGEVEGLGLVGALAPAGAGPADELKGDGAVGLEVTKATISPAVARTPSATGSLAVGVRVSRESARFWLERR
jgi:hypothetical protein